MFSKPGLPSRYRSDEEFPDRGSGGRERVGISDSSQPPRHGRSIG